MRVQERRHAEPSHAAARGGGAPAAPSAAPPRIAVSSAPIHRKASAAFEQQLDSLSLKAAGPEQTAAQGFSGGKQTLPYRSELESAFGTGLGHVNAHTGPNAADACSQLGAEAYAMGNNIAFKTSSPDKGTVAHEVTHVLQQGGGVARKGITGYHDAAEVQARSVETAVNQGRTVAVGGAASTGAVSLDAFDTADTLKAAEGDAFWSALKDATSTELTNYCANVLGTAVSSFGDAMQAQSEGGAGALALNSIITLVGGIPGDLAGAASAIAQVAVALYTYIEAQTGRPQVDYLTFMSNARTGQSQLSAEITGRSHAIFRAIDGLKATETAESRAAVRQQALAEVRRARSALPSMQRHLQAMTVSWVEGATDSADWGDPDDMSAGYVSGSCTIREYDYSRGVDRSAFIDDVERPAGTIQAMKQAFGEGTFLDQTPLRMHISVSVENWEDTGTQRGYRRSGSTAATLTKGQGSAPLTLVGGERSIMDAYMTHGRLRVSDLTED